MAVNIADSTSCRLEGKLFTGVQLERIFERKGTLQTDRDYNIPEGLSLKEEVARAYRIASSAYFKFKRAVDNPSYSDDIKLEATKAFAHALFNSALDYNLPLSVDNLPIDQTIGHDHYVLTFPVSMLLDQEAALHKDDLPQTSVTTNIKPLSGNDGQRVSAIIPLTVVYPCADPKNPKKRSTLDTVLPACSIINSKLPNKPGRRSAFAMTQELLNISAQYLWGFAFNGYSLRLLRDVMTIARPSFVEFDLESIFEGDNQAEFSHLYLMLHSSRTKVDDISGLNAWELWLKLSAEEGIPAREQLSASMQEAMVCLGTGFLRAKGQGNDRLRAKLANHELSATDYNHQLMRLMYRFLFVFCLEERGIVHTRLTKDDITQRLAVLQAHALQDKLAAERNAALEQDIAEQDAAQSETQDGDDTWFEQGTFNLDWDEEPQKEDEPITRSTVVRDYGRARALYDEGYSLQRMRDMSLKQRLYTDYHDLWESVKVVFKAFATGEDLLALPALGGLFTEDQCPDLMDVNLTNADLLHAMRLMRWAKLQGVVSRIDYANMNTEELGSLYEGLLELVPVVKFVDEHNRHSFTFDFAQGNANERKSSGSYYTPDSLVQSLIETALNPVIEQKLKENPNDPETALLSLKVIDPACGSGHFLLAAARRIAAVIMEQKAYLGAPANVEYRKTLHEVISHCIYGVDLNPMAVELARMALWLEGFAENKPLSFIDHHLLVGNALLGVMDIDVLKLGIPSDAYKPQAPIGKGQYALTLSDKTVCATLKKRNTKERKVFIENQMDTGLNGLASLGSAIQHLGYINLDQLAADTLQAEENKAAQNARNQQAIEDTVEFKACNLLLSAFLSEKTQATESLVPTCQDLDLLLTDPEGFAQSHAAMLEHAHQVCADNHVLHWPFAFMEVMAKGGFDCVLGNPPWEKPKIEDVKWFATRLPEVAAAKTAAIRQKMIEALASSEDARQRDIFVDYVRAQHQAAAFSTINHLSGEDGGRFPLTGIGDTNLFAYFAELALNARKEHGAVGMVLPAGILLDDATKRFTQEVFSEGLVHSVYHFNNTAGIFPDVDGRYTFVLLTLAQADKADCVFYATDPKQLENEKLHLSYEPGDIELINPNTQTALLVRSEYDLELCRKLYHAAPVLIRDASTGSINPWQLQTMAMFHMANDSSNFVVMPTKEANTAAERWLVPLYEGKMFWQFDHRFSSLGFFGEDGTGSLFEPKPVILDFKQQASYRIVPRYWVLGHLVQERWQQKGWDQPWTIAWRDISSATNERTIIATVLPTAYGVGHTAGLMMPKVEPKQAACLLALLNSLVIDYVERIKQSSAHASLFYLKQLPILPPEAFSPEDVEFIASRVAQLTRTADDINAVWLTEYPAYTFQEPRARLSIRAQLDAYIAKMYGLTREELAYILDPTAVMGSDHPSVTFPGLKRKETELYGEYLTQRLVLTAYDAIAAGMLK